MALLPESAAPPQGISILGFQFSYRNGMFDWRLLHGINVDAVVRKTKQFKGFAAVSVTLHAPTHSTVRIGTVGL